MLKAKPQAGRGRGARWPRSRPASDRVLGALSPRPATRSSSTASPAIRRWSRAVRAAWPRGRCRRPRILRHARGDVRDQPPLGRVGRGCDSNVRAGGADARATSCAYWRRGARGRPDAAGDHEDRRLSHDARAERRPTCSTSALWCPRSRRSPSAPAFQLLVLNGVGTRAPRNSIRPTYRLSRRATRASIMTALAPILEPSLARRLHPVRDRAAARRSRAPGRDELHPELVARRSTASTRSW